MLFADQLALLLPPDLPNRDALVAGAARHLEMIVEVNRYMNLTRIVEPREAVMKHILDSVMPWTLFRGAKHVLDAGTGAGFPGIPLALMMPGIHWTLSESTQKKARFVETVVAELKLPNVEVRAERAEDVLREGRIDLIAARALAPLHRALTLFGPALKSGARALFYKGPDTDIEVSEATVEARKYRVQLKPVMRYELPDGLGSRTMILAAS